MTSCFVSTGDGDVDGDGVRYPDDGCEFTAGLAGNQGCPSGASPDAETSKG